MIRGVDAMIAEHVMGLEPWPGKPGAFKAPIVLPHHEAKPCEPPEYSRDISAAWMVFYKLKTISRVSEVGGDERTYTFKVFWDETGNAWAAEFEWSYYDKLYEVRADSAPLAICLAALKAVGVAG